MLCFRKEIYVEVDAKLGYENASDGYFVGARIYQGGCWLYDSTGIFFFVYPHPQRFVVTGNIGRFILGLFDTLFDNYCSPRTSVRGFGLRLIITAVS